MMVGPGAPIAAGGGDLAVIRQAIQSKHRLRIAYGDEQGGVISRTISLFVLAFYDRVRVVVAWCELHEGYRHFRADRIMALETLAGRYLRRRAVLLKEWRALRDIPEQ